MKWNFLLLTLFLFYISEFKAQTTQKVHLFEQFTSTSCPTCGNRNPEFYDEVLEPYGEQIIHIAYHNHLPLTLDPFYQANISENRERSDFYNVRASPSLVLDGKLLTPSRPLFKGSEVEAILEETSSLKLDVTHFKRDGDFNVKVDAEMLQNLPAGDYKLYIAAVEKEILFCTYFEYVFDNVFRAFLEEGNGISFNLNDTGESETYNKKITFNDDWEYSMLYAVAFVQNTATNEIINAGASKIIDKGESGRFSNDEFKLTSKVYHSFCGSPFGSIELGICVDAAPIEFPEDVSFKWSNGETTQNLTNVPPGIYTVEIKDNKYETSIEQTFEILTSEAIEVEEIITPANAANQSGSAEIMPIGSYGGFTIEWNDGNTNFNRNDLIKGEYYYLITDSRGCQKENGVTIERDFTTNDVEVNIKNVSCNGEEDGSITINLLGLSDGDIVLFFKEDEMVQNPSQLPAGQYNYKVIDSFEDVLLEDAFTISEPEKLVAEILVNDENQLITTVSGGVSPYTYLWSDGTNTSNIESPATNYYSLIVTDANGCQTENSINIERQFTSNDVIISIENVSCNGENDGSVNIELLNSFDGDVVLVFKEDALVENTDQLLPGAYIYHVIESNSDILIKDTFEITEPDILLADIILTDENHLLANVLGGTPPYTYLWNDGTSAQSIETPTNYDNSVIVTDINGCMAAAARTFTDIEYQNDQLSKIKIFPNPVKSGNLVSVTSSHQLEDIQIFGIDGSLIGGLILLNKNNIIANRLSSGVYIIKVFLLNDDMEYIKLLVE